MLLSLRAAIVLVSMTSSVLAQATLFTANGGPGTGHYGTSLDFVQDLNGDGLAELVAGAHLDGTQASQAGRVRVLSGLDGSVLFELFGESAGDHFGFAVSRAGDVNGDGLEDFVVGAPQAGTNSDGKVYIFSGANGSELLAVSGANPFIRLGVAVSAAGDVNSDGFADILVGANGDDLNPNDNRGSASVLSGADGSTLFKFWGTNDIDGCGRAVAYGGDVNNDGQGDFIVSSLAVSDPNAHGEVQVFSGADGTRLWRLQASTPFEWFGVSVAGPGDLDADGFDDVLVGAKTARPNNVFNAGAARLFSGATGNLIYELSEGVPSEFFGDAVAAAGDVNGDGTGDILVGAPLAINLGRKGDAHVYSGVNGAPLFVFIGDSFDDDFGDGVAGGGDITGDGLADLAVGAPRADPNGSSSGMVRLFSGGTSTCFDVSNYCSTSPNSAGAGALISHIGSPSLSANKLWLHVQGAPANTPGVFLYGGLEAQTPFGNGDLCLGPPYARTSVQSGDGAGLVTFQFDAAASVAAGVISPGTRWRFQYHYRDVGVGAGFNLSDGLRIVFCP